MLHCMIVIVHCIIVIVHCIIVMNPRTMRDKCDESSGESCIISD